jgi:dihydropteroate synthase
MQILGILNITDDSFSDGGKYLAPEAALAHGLALMEEGADILDIGAAWSKTHAKNI